MAYIDSGRADLREDSEMGKRPFVDVCGDLESNPVIRGRDIFGKFGLLSGHPWEETAASEDETYYPAFYGIVRNESPRKVLEIGTAFGMSAATALAASPQIELFVSVDLGIYSSAYSFPVNNIDFVRQHIHAWCREKGFPTERVRFYKANTQPEGSGDNEDNGSGEARWNLIPELVRILEDNEFDLIFVDGKHTGRGLFNDLKSFWPFLRQGGLALCDDLHDRNVYAGVFPWAGDTVDSFNAFLELKRTEIADSHVWGHPSVPPGGYKGIRPFGLIRKKEDIRPRVEILPLDQTASEFATFDYPDAMAINRARQDHLASLGLDLAGKSVLEVGAGVGWHAGFFEKLGCSALSTDARPGNVQEILRRYPGRRAEVADLSVSGSHDRFGKFDVVYCYGTLYHLKDPALCLKDLSNVCTGLMLLETCVNLSDNGSINLVGENRDNPNQSFEGLGCRPARDWIVAELKKYFPYVYVSVSQPDYMDFPLEWPVTLSPGVQNARS
ncbi:MAG: class I SAM-dependent methyltransferase, partial [Nitrospiraceae bacterium]|nr:class I SAM-dependent methyltransferase [Nitrospiraceae bacterium]